MNRLISTIVLFFLMASSVQARRELRITLRYDPQENTGGPEVLVGSMPAIDVRSMADERQNPDRMLVGENREHRTPVPVRATSSVAVFAADVLKRCLSEWGFRVVPGAELVLRGEIVSFFVSEDSTYAADVRIRFILENQAGEVQWEGIATGAATRFGRSLSEENYNEVLSDATKAAYANLVGNKDLQSAWSGRRAPAAAAVLTPAALKEKILTLMNAGLAQDVIVSFVEQNPPSPRLSVEEIVSWKQAGIPDRVIDAAIQPRESGGSEERPGDSGGSTPNRPVASALPRPALPSPASSAALASGGSPAAEIATRPPPRSDALVHAGPRTAFEPRAVDIKLVEEPGQLGHAWTTVDYAVLGETVTRVELGLFQQAFDAGSGEHRRSVEGRVIAVADASGAPLRFAHERGSLSVVLNEAAHRGENVRLRFEYTIPLMRYGEDRRWLLDVAWYPICESISRSWISLHAEVRALAPLTPLGSGRVVRRWTDGEHLCVELEEKRNSAFPVLGAGVYFPYEFTDAKGRQITVYSYGVARKQQQKEFAERAASLIRSYETLYPPYPYSSVAIVEANRYYGSKPGMTEYPAGLATTPYISLTQSDFDPSAGENRGDRSSANFILAFELGHSWWLNYFRLETEDDRWLSESFTMYSLAWVLTVARAGGAMDEFSDTWRSEAKATVFSIPVVAASRISSLAGAGDKAKEALLYFKGPWVLHCLRSEIGDEAFFTMMRSFLRSFEGKRARTEDLLGLVNFITKKEWRPWFDRYVFGAEFPELKI